MRTTPWLILTAAIPLGAAETVTASSHHLEPFGLSGHVVTSLAIYNSLYAGTIGQGVFRRDLSDPDAGWISLGLTGKRIRAVYPHSLSLKLHLLR